MGIITRVVDFFTESKKCIECGKRRRENVWKHMGNGVKSGPLCRDCFGRDKYDAMRSLRERY